MSLRAYRNTLAVGLLLLVVLACLGHAGAESGSDLGQVVAVVDDGTKKAKEIATGLVLLFASLLAIAIVAMLYRRTASSS